MKSFQDYLEEKQEEIIAYRAFTRNQFGSDKAPENVLNCNGKTVIGIGIKSKMGAHLSNFAFLLEPKVDGRQAQYTAVKEITLAAYNKAKAKKDYDSQNKEFAKILTQKLKYKFEPVPKGMKRNEIV